MVDSTQAEESDSDATYMQVPLGARYNEVIPEHRRFTPQMLVTKLQEEGKQVRQSAVWRLTDALPLGSDVWVPHQMLCRNFSVISWLKVGLVIDLTRSSQYYSKEEWLGVACHKVRRTSTWRICALMQRHVCKYRR